jgi:hypothetical protein
MRQQYVMNARSIRVFKSKNKAGQLAHLWIPSLFTPSSRSWTGGLPVDFMVGTVMKKRNGAAEKIYFYEGRAEDELMNSYPANFSYTCTNSQCGCSLPE